MFAWNSHNSPRFLLGINGASLKRSHPAKRPTCRLVVHFLLVSIELLVTRRRPLCARTRGAYELSRGIHGILSRPTISAITKQPFLHQALLLFLKYFTQLPTIAPAKGGTFPEALGSLCSERVMRDATGRVKCTRRLINVALHVRCPPRRAAQFQASRGITHRARSTAVTWKMILEGQDS